MAINPLPLAGVGLAAIAVAGGLYATGTGTSDTPPAQTLVWQSLSKDSDYQTKIGDSSGNEYKNKYGETYGSYLTGTDKKNEAWWEDAFTNKYKPKKETVSDKFTKSLTNGEALKNKCVEAYKLSTATGTSPVIKTESAGITESDFLESNIWLFCTPGNGKPKTISQIETDKSSCDSKDSSYGKDTSKNTKLISTKDTNNDWFWKLKEEEFKVLVTDFENSSEFKKLFSTRSEMNSETRKVRDLCQQAYDYNTSSDKGTKYKEADVLKYCSLEGK